MRLAVFCLALAAASANNEPAGSSPDYPNPQWSKGWCNKWEQLPDEGQPGYKAQHGRTFFHKPTSPTDCSAKCDAHPDCTQAVYEEGGPWGQECWLGGKTADKTDRGSRGCDGEGGPCVDHCYHTGLTTTTAAAGSALTTYGRHMTAIVRFDNVSTADMNAAQGAFVSEIATRLSTTTAHVAMDNVQERTGLTGSACTRLELGGLATDSPQASRQGFYFHTRQTFNDRPVFFSPSSGNYLYYYATKGWWLVGPTLGSEYASLITNYDAASPLDIPTSANWYVSSGAGGWKAATGITFGCSPAPYVDVTFRVGLECDSSADISATLRQNTLQMLAPLRAHGLLATSIGLVRTHTTSCAPKIKLEMPGVDALRPWQLKTECHYNGHHLVIKHHKPDSHHHFACRHQYDHLREKWDCACKSWPNVEALPTPSPTPAPPTPAPLSTTTTTTTTLMTTTTTAAPSTTSTLQSTPAPTSHTEADARAAFPQCTKAMLAECRKETVDCQHRSGVRTAQYTARLSGVCPKPSVFDFSHSSSFQGTIPNNVDINHAGLKALESIYGIGPSKSQNIIDYRKQNGYFDSVSALAKVAGIGQLTVAAMFEKAGAGSYSKPVVTWSARTEALPGTKAPTAAYGEWVFKDWWKMDEVQAGKASAIKQTVGSGAPEPSSGEPATSFADWSPQGTGATSPGTGTAHADSAPNQVAASAAATYN